MSVLSVGTSVPAPMFWGWHAFREFAAIENATLDSKEKPRVREITVLNRKYSFRRGFSGKTETEFSKLIEMTN
jgi:hypothetical protein